MVGEIPGNLMGTTCVAAEDSLHSCSLATFTACTIVLACASFRVRRTRGKKKTLQWRACVCIQFLMHVTAKTTQRKDLANHSLFSKRVQRFTYSCPRHLNRPCVYAAVDAMARVQFVRPFQSHACTEYQSPLCFQCPHFSWHVSVSVAVIQMPAP